MDFVDTLRPFVYGMFAGILVGVIPKRMATKLGLNKFGLYSQLACAFAGMFGGLIFAIPVCILLVIIINRKI